MTAMPHLPAIDWDHADQMQHADLDGGGDVWFQYDAAGNRVRKVQVNSAGSAANERVYLGGVEVYRQRAVASGVLGAVNDERETLHIADDAGRVVMVETLTIDGATPVSSPANVARYQYGNHLGTVALELDESAAIISYEEFHPYGSSAYRAVDSAIGVSAKRYRYTGKERDEETGLDLMGARYYAPWLGRWTASDPVGLRGGLNRYEYAASDPVRLSDPSGTAPASSTTSDDSQGQQKGVQQAAVEENFAALQDVLTTGLIGEEPINEARAAEEAAVAIEATAVSGGFGYGQYVAVVPRAEGYAVEQAPGVLGAADGLLTIAEGTIDAFTPRLKSRPSDKTPNIIGVIEEGADLVASTGRTADALADAQADVEIAEATGDVAAANRARVERGRSGVFFGAGVTAIIGAGAGVGKLGGPGRTRIHGGGGGGGGGGSHGEIALDTSVLIDVAPEAALGRALPAADAAIGGRVPVVSRPAAKEFLGGVPAGPERAARANFLRSDLFGARRGRLAGTATDAEVANLQARVGAAGPPHAAGVKVKPTRPDADIAAAAEKLGLPLLTSDSALYKQLLRIGFPVELFTK